MTVSEINYLLNSMNLSEYNKLIHRIKSYRKNAGLTQAELAQNLNVTQACISTIESGKLRAIGNTLIPFCNYFNVDVYRFIEGDIPLQSSACDLRLGELLTPYDLYAEEDYFVKSFLQMSHSKRASIITALKALKVYD